MKIHKGDEVIVLSGKDKGKKAEVVRAIPSREPRHSGRRQRGQAPRQADARHPAGRRDRQVHAGARLDGGAWSARAATSPRGSGYKFEDDGEKVRVLQEVRVDAVSTTSAPARPRLKERYLTEVRDSLKEGLGLGNVMEVPRLDKIVINMGVGRATQQASLIEGAQRDLETITGQKPIVTRAKQSIAGFKLREGQAIGVKATLRGDRAWEFFDRLLSLAIPRIRDFRGLSPRSFDGHGNYTFGVTEQLIFPEIDYDKIDTTRGMDITIVTTARTNEEGRAFLAAFGFPFRQETR